MIPRPIVLNPGRVDAAVLERMVTCFQERDGAGALQIIFGELLDWTATDVAALAPEDLTTIMQELLRQASILRLLRAPAGRLTPPTA